MFEVIKKKGGLVGVFGGGGGGNCSIKVNINTLFVNKVNSMLYCNRKQLNLKGD